ncbi:MAG: methyl-accepting chemotaxis protein [Spirochaetales bacterium]|uniref:Methyl-accepting chemotaxis protein n=1 Tax=Candidatus Thalassospirochaeta sargassi TaxID=3119039 RepID=A0AAJ1MK80_9SPIO|nr:methyl-accepting chemotaxis protein [Spirochaetales bacterium]
MKIPDSNKIKKRHDELLSRLENSSAKSFSIQMVMSTVFTYLAAVTVMILIDLILYQGTGGHINFTGLLLYFLSTSLMSFIPIAVVSAIIVQILIRPIYRIMKRNETGDTISEEEFFAARRRSIAIAQIIFILNLVTPFIIKAVDGSFDEGIAKGLVILAKDVSIFILAALVQNALYQRILIKPRAIMKIYSVDETSKSWFVKNMNRIQLYASILFIAAILFHSAMTIVKEVSVFEPAVPENGVMVDQSEQQDRTSDALESMHKTMQEQSIIEPAGTEGDVPQMGLGRIQIMILLLILLAIGIISIVDSIVSRARYTQTQILRNVLSDMAEGSGDLTQRVLIVQADDNGTLSHQLNRVLDRLQTMFRNISKQTDSVADATKAVSAVLEGTVAATEEMTASVSQINSNTARNQAVVKSSQESLNNMLSSLSQINKNVNTQAAYVEQTSSAMTEMIANIQSVNEVTSKANEVSEALKNVSDQGGRAVTNSITAVRDIEESSNEVNNLVQIITKILAATNMLAMNAAIEAAHAGDAGRGFAVVAEEVRNLADDSAGNLKTISENIKIVMERVDRGVKLSENAGQALNDVGLRTDETTRLMSEVASAMQEQAAGANEVLNSINSLVDASSSINRLSEEQQQNNEDMKDNLNKTINAFSEVQSATSELELGNREILNGIEELKEVIRKNEDVVASLQEELGGFKI